MLQEVFEDVDEGGERHRVHAQPDKPLRAHIGHVASKMSESYSATRIEIGIKLGFYSQFNLCSRLAATKSAIPACEPRRSHLLGVCFGNKASLAQVDSHVL